LKKRKDEFPAGRLKPDKEPYWVKIRYHPPAGWKSKNFRNEGVQFVQLHPYEVRPFHLMLEEYKKEGLILDYMTQLIQEFWSSSKFMKDMNDSRAALKKMADAAKTKRGTDHGKR